MRSLNVECVPFISTVMKNLEAIAYVRKISKTITPYIVSKYMTARLNGLTVK